MSRLEARRSRIGFAALALWLAFPASALAQSSHLVIVVGLAGDPEHGELFQKWGTTLASTATEKLLVYALGRGVEYYDLPAIRTIVRDAAPGDYKWSSIIVGITKSVPFQMRSVKSGNRVSG